MDPFLLTAHINICGNKKILDIGCGCAIMPIILNSKWPDLTITGIEIQKELYESARHNIICLHLEKMIHIIHEDIKNIQLSDIGGPADIIISNPPYKKKGTGRLNPDRQKAIARHEITIDIDRVFYYSDRLLRPGGQFYIIFPAERLPDLFSAMNQYNFSPDFIRFIHVKKDSNALRVILCAGKNHGKSCVIHPPLYIHDSKNRFTREYISMVQTGLDLDTFTKKDYFALD